MKSPWAIPNDPRITGHRPSEECPDCGADDLNCRCDEEFPEDLDCTYCGGEGTEWGYEKGDPLMYDDNQLYPCFACNGSGHRRDQWFF